MRRRFSTLLALTTLAMAVGCAGSDATAPSRFGSAARASDKGASQPGVVGSPHIIANGQGGLQGCTPRDPQVGSAFVGPSGGELVVGSNRLIIPAGALTDTVTISGTSPADGVIYFEPHGLQFKKSAGLILDTSSCTDVPDVVYINEIGVLSDPILAIYSTWWHTIAAPIDHFSGYAVAF